ncbi:carbonic anhydrase 4-like [Cynoglossus semilaevis]|uniref:carbonic anhydrase 4-like n=1 Tax=Cynoglossus semilaevis TaxID=244447 RepID=UPI000D629F0F|nr:carbonic anhydrase 4-like [Cynoglossus semilaevis]
MKNPTHPANVLFVRLHSGRWLRSIKDRNTRLRNSFFPGPCWKELIQLSKENKSGEADAPAYEDTEWLTKMEIFVTAVFAICTFIPSIYCAGNTVAWCYHLSTCNDAKWPEIAPQFCNGSRQSPINIATSAVKPDSKLTAFTFENFHRKSVLKTITNTGKTVKVNFRSGVKVKGGDLPEEYDSLQFHLHWGNGASVPGSEHTVDGKRYPMELHIVNIKSSYNGNTTLGVADSMGLAALGFFIEVKYMSHFTTF